MAEEKSPIKVIWFTNLYEKPDIRNNPFWDLTKHFIKASAEDLDMELEIVYTEQNHIYLLEKAEQLLNNTDTRPDAILFHNYKYTGKKILEIAEKNEVNSFVFNAGFAETESVGKPRELYKHWIGELYPDDKYAGWLLAKKLMEEARKLPAVKQSGKVQVFSFAGSKHSQASILRVEGNNQYQREDSEYDIISTFYADWRKQIVLETTGRVIKRQTDLKIFWTASDLMAQGVIEGAIKSGWQPGRDFVVGGVDCLPEAQKLIKKGQMAVSVGGHYVDGAWAILLIHDYLKGIDFSDISGVTLFSKMFALTSGDNESSGDLSYKLTKDYIYAIDFKQYSRWYHKAITGYSFDAIDFLGIGN